MVRLLVLLAIVVLAVVIVMRLVKMLAATRPPDARGGDGAAGASEATLVKCIRCGAFVPRADALPAPGGFLCSDPKCRNTG